MKIIKLFSVAALVCSMAASCAFRSKVGGDTGSDGSSAVLAAKVVRISEEYTNINMDVGRAELSRLGIGDKDVFVVKFGDHTIRVLLGGGYGDVAKGEWVALIEEDGKLQLAISYGNAATEIGCAVGDTLYLERTGIVE